MNTRSRAVGAIKTRVEPGTGFLYGWLLVALFVEYARPASQFTFLDFPFFYSIVPLSLLAITVFAPGLRPMKEVLADRITRWIFVFLGLVLLSVVISPVFDYSWNVAIGVLGRVFLFIMICRLMTTEARIRGVIFTLFLAHVYLLAMNPDILLNPEQRNYIDGATFLGDGNDFALSLCILLPCMIEVASASRNRFAKLISWIGAIVIVLSIISTQSRGGTLGLVAVLLYLWWRSPRKIAAAVGIGILCAGALVFAPSEYFARMQTLQDTSADGSAQGRINAWKAAIGMGVKHPLGVGTGHFGPRWGHTAHSTYMLAFAELGPLGFVCTLVLVFGNLSANSRLRRALLAREAVRPGERLRQLTRMLDLLNAAMVGFAVAGAFLSATYYPHMYVLSALLISARILASQHAGLLVTRRK